MKDKIKAFFQKSEDYYSPDKNLTPEKELKILRKENEKLKEEFFHQTLDSMKTRRSVRSFSQTPFDEKILYDCIEASLNSPAAGNIQNYKLILVKDKDKKNEIGKMALQQSWISDTPIIAIVVRNDTPISQMFPQHGDRYSLQNSSCFIDALLYSIHSAGLATCWVEACEEGVLKEYLGIPGDKFIDAILPIGYPLEIPKVNKISYEDVVFFENHGNKRK